MMRLIRWIRNVIRLNKKPNEPIFLGAQVPVNQSPEFINHKHLVERFFNFLEKEWGFPSPRSEWQSREYHTVYKKEKLTIEIIYETSMLPHVSISQSTESNSNFVCYNPVGLDVKDNFRQLYATRSARLAPKNARYFDRMKYDNIYDSRELQDNYQQWGRAEHETVLRLYADVIKQHPEVLQCNFEAFPSTNPPSS